MQALYVLVEWILVPSSSPWRVLVHLCRLSTEILLNRQNIYLKKAIEINHTCIIFKENYFGTILLQFEPVLISNLLIIDLLPEVNNKAVGATK